MRALRDTAPDVPGLAGVGMAWDRDSAWALAVAEAVERCSSATLAGRELRWATALELGGDGLDLATVPVCSERELAHPACPVRRPDPSAAMRWVRGVSLMRLAPVWLPAVMVHIRIPKLAPGEHFWLPTSSGCAAHPVLAQALVNAICEVVERDAVALLWLQRMRVPRVDLDGGLPAVPSRAGTISLFDATTDVGVPCLYAVDRAPEAGELATLVCAAADLEPRRAAEKVLAEAILYRPAMERPPAVPEDPDLFTQPAHGAVHMSSPSRRHAFDFLLGTRRRRALSELPALDAPTPAAALAGLLDRLRALAMEAFAVELTTGEARAAGLRVVRVVVPALQPLTYRTRARYLGHPRLRRAPLRMGHRAHPEDEINPWPQPFG